MDHRKISQSLQASAQGVKIKVKSVCETPTSLLVTNQKPSIYEIEILSSVDFGRNNKRELDVIDIPMKLSLSKGASRVLEIKGKESVTNCSVFKVPMIDPYKIMQQKMKLPINHFQTSDYATFQQSQSTVKGISFKKEKIDSIMQTDLNFDDTKPEEKEKKASKETVDEEFQSSSQDFKEFLKNIMIENLILRDSSAMKILFKNFCEKLNKKQLHLHHHEHHHHYYFDDPNGLNRNASSFSHNKASEKSQKVKSDDESNDNKGGKFQTGKDIEKEQPTNSRHYVYPKGSNLTFTKASSGMTLKSESNELLKANENKTKKKSLVTFEPSQLKFSSSFESIFNKKSDFFTAHVYSDTELLRCDSEMLHMAAISEFEKESSKESQQDEDNDFKVILNDFKNFNLFKSPRIIANQIMKPLISYVKCESASLKSSSAMRNDQPFFDTKISVKKVKNQDKTHSREEKSEEEYLDKGTDNIQNVLPIPEKKNEEDFPRQNDSEIWTAKLKMELGEIKKELKRIEERHLNKKYSFVSIPRSNKSIDRSGSSRNVTVYSSKTFIIGADSFYLTQKGNQEQLEEEKSASKNKLAFQETGNEQEGWHYKEKRAFLE